MTDTLRSHLKASMKQATKAIYGGSEAGKRTDSANKKGK